MTGLPPSPTAAASQFLLAPAEDIIEQIIVQCWLFQARGGDYGGARMQAERTLERLLARGLPARTTPGGALLLDPYAANNTLKSRVGEPADQAWPDWQATTRRNACSLPAAARLYRFRLRREWHRYAAAPGRPLIFRLPLPLRQSQRGPARLQVLEPAAALLEQREMPGRLEFRLDAAKVHGPVAAELTVDLAGGELRDPLEPSSALGEAVGPEDQVWLRGREGPIAPSPQVAALAAGLAAGQDTARGLVHAAWDWLIANLRFGDVHRSDLGTEDPLGAVLRLRLADCALGSSLLVAICRARGVPARLVSGFLLHPANLGPHYWAEVRLAPGRWVPFDFGSWCYCAGDPQDPVWGCYFRGRVDARFLAEVAPHDFTGWGSAPPPEHWFRLERLRGDRIEHSLHALPDGALFRRDLLDLELPGPAPA